MVCFLHVIYIRVCVDTYNMKAHSVISYLNVGSYDKITFHSYVIFARMIRHFKFALSALMLLVALCLRVFVKKYNTVFVLTNLNVYELFDTFPGRLIFEL